MSNIDTTLYGTNSTSIPIKVANDNDFENRLYFTLLDKNIKSCNPLSSTNMNNCNTMYNNINTKISDQLKREYTNANTYLYSNPVDAQFQDFPTFNNNDSNCTPTTGVDRTLTQTASYIFPIINTHNSYFKDGFTTADKQSIKNLNINENITVTNIQTSESIKFTRINNTIPEQYRLERIKNCIDTVPDNYCVNNAGTRLSTGDPRRSLIYKGTDCIGASGWTNTNYFKGYSAPLTNGEKFCYRHYVANSQARSILWKASLTNNDCTGTQGWGTDIGGKYGSGGELYLYTSAPNSNAKKVCYRTDNTGYTKTVLYNPINNSCGDDFDTNNVIGSGGEFYTTDALLSLNKNDFRKAPCTSSGDWGTQTVNPGNQISRICPNGDTITAKCDDTNFIDIGVCPASCTSSGIWGNQTALSGKNISMTCPDSTVRTATCNNGSFINIGKCPKYIFQTYNSSGNINTYAMPNDGREWEDANAGRNSYSALESTGIYGGGSNKLGSTGDGYEFKNNSDTVFKNSSNNDSDNSHGTGGTNSSTNVFKLTAPAGYTKESKYLYRYQSGADYVYAVFRNNNW